MVRMLAVFLCCNGCAIALGAELEWQPHRPDLRNVAEPRRLDETHLADVDAEPLQGRDVETRGLLASIGIKI